MIKTEGVVHFSIPVSDLDRSEKFYQKFVGLETVMRAPEALGLLFMKSGEDFVILVKSKTPIEPNPGEERWVHHAFRVADDAYEAARDYLIENGVHVIHEEERHDGVFRGKQCHFHDPDRNVLEIIALSGIGP